MSQGLIVLVVLAFPVVAIVALVMASGARKRLLAFEVRLAALERQRAHAPAAPAVPPPRTRGRAGARGPGRAGRAAHRDRRTESRAARGDDCASGGYRPAPTDNAP